MNSSQAYKTLEIESNTDFEEVKYAYRKLALQYHPDKNKDSEIEKRFKIITEAYHFLKNQNKHSTRQKPEKPREESDYTQTNQNSTREQNGEKMEKEKHPKLIGESTQKISKQMRNGGKDMKMSFGKNMKKLLTSKQKKSQIEDLQRNVKNLN